MLSLKKVKNSELKKLNVKNLLKIMDIFDDAKEKSYKEYYRREEIRISKALKELEYSSQSVENAKRKRTQFNSEA